MSQVCRFGAFICIFLLLSCVSEPKPDIAGDLPGPAIFEEIAAQVGLDFIHENGRSGKFYMPEIMGAGVGLLDFDNDGDLDVYLCQGRPFEPVDGAGNTGGGRLFRNDLIPGGSLAFTDVTFESGIMAREYGMGVAVGDVDNNGYPDLYLTNLGPNQLWLNRGDGVFVEDGSAAGVDDSSWSVSAAFLDYDKDGLLDLFVANYVNFSLASHKDCYHGQLDYCHPNSYQPQSDRLYRNMGDGTFQNRTGPSRIGSAYGNGLGVVSADFNGDHLPDIFVANDGMANQCWINQGDGKFEDTALIAGSALNHSGQAEAGMGVSAIDFDMDGDEDLFLTHLTGQTNTLYINDGSGMFEDRTIGFGLGGPSNPFTGFGTVWFDYDNDGGLDLFAVNGTVTATGPITAERFPYDQTNQLFRFEGGRFVDISVQAGLTRSEISRGAALGDVDNDGDLDLVVSNNSGPVRLLRNELGAAKPWIGLDVLHEMRRSAIGARVKISQTSESGLTIPDRWRTVSRSGSYASASDVRLVVGLGAGGKSPVNVSVIWPNGERQSWDQLMPNQYHQIIYGQGNSGQK